MRDHTRLRAFVLADEIVIMTYQITKFFPREETYSIAAQMRRAAVSVPSNIVEGCARGGYKEYRRFLKIAFASLKELHYQYSIAKRLGYLKKNRINNYEAKVIETEKVLAALIRSLNNLQ